MKETIIFFCVIAVTVHVNAQGRKDSLKVANLDSVTIVSYYRQPSIARLNDVQGTYIFAGKKSEVINLTALDADITNKNARQAFAKVPGIFVYDMDGSGNQINIAARGLDPHRGWDFNIRKDGILTNSDMYGYPASHYSMPLESIGKIEIVRGTGSLQYGAQFGGMLNYVTKQPDTSRSFNFESINTVGSYHLISTYNAIGGKIGKLRYYAYYNKKSRDGYRGTEHTESEAQDIILTYEADPKLTLRLEWARSKYLYRLPGQLNDSLFEENPRQSTRSRNYFSPDIHIPSFTAMWQPSPGLSIQYTSSAVLGRRNSVLFNKPITVADTIVAGTGQYNNRQVDIDRYNSYTNELRALKNYSVGNKHGNIVAGVQYMHNDLHRTQLGRGTTGTDYDLSLVEEGWGRDIHFKTKNLAVYAENNFKITEELSFTTGVRIEQGQTDLSGSIVYYPENEIPVTIRHRFPLFGAGFAYKPYRFFEFYGGWSQAYHPVLFKDLVPSSLFEKVDPDIRDGRGFNIESGARGEAGPLNWDISTFIIQYNNRFGTLSQTDDNGEFYTYRTNTGNSLTLGAEIFVQAEFMVTPKMELSIFTSTSLMDARYKNAFVKSGDDNINIDGNRVESAPGILSRNGASLRFRKMSVTALYSYTGETYADALNTEIPPATGVVGLVPSYGLFDVNGSFRILAMLDMKVNINNVFNKQYFTKRPSFYPGPGIWPSEGRNLNVSFIVRI